MKRLNSLNTLLFAAALFFGVALSFNVSGSTAAEASISSGECLRCVDGETCTRSLSGGTQCYGDCTHDDNCSTKIEPLPPIILSQ